MQNLLFDRKRVYLFKIFIFIFYFFIVFTSISYLKYGFVDYNFLIKENKIFSVSFSEIIKIKEDKLINQYLFKVNQNDQILNFKFENKGFKYLTIYVNALNIKTGEFKIEYLDNNKLVGQEEQDLKMGMNIYKLPLKLNYNEISIISKSELSYNIGISGISMSRYFDSNDDLLIFCIVLFILMLLIQLKKIRNILYYFIKPIEEYYSKLKLFIKFNIKGVIGIIFLNLVTFGFLVTNFTMSLDEELKLMNPADMGWVGYGRFGIYFLNEFLLVDEKFTPYFSDFFAALFLGIATILFLFYFEEKSNEKNEITLSMFIFSGLFMSVPLVVGEYMSFALYNMELGLGYILVACSLYFSNKFVLNNSYNNLFLAFLTLTISISIYQSFISVYVSGTILGVLICLLNKNEEKKYYTILINIVKNIIILCISVLAYYMLNKYFQSTITAPYGYINNLIGWNKGDFFNVLNTTFGDILEILLGKFDESGVVIFISSIIFVSYIIIKVFFIQQKSKQIFFLFFSLCFILSPFLIMLALGNKLPGRAMQALPLFLGGMWYLMLKYPINVVSKKISVIISMFLIFIQLQYINIMFYGDYLRYQQDIYLGRQIMMSLEHNDIDYKKKPMVFIGSRKLDSSYLISKINTGGKSFFGNESQMYRMTFFINSLGYNVITPTYEEMDKGRKYNDEMATWPKDGSIKELEDMIVIKLSESNYLKR